MYVKVTGQGDSWIGSIRLKESLPGSTERQVRKEGFDTNRCHGRADGEETPGEAEQRWYNLCPKSGNYTLRKTNYERFAQWRSLAAISKRKLISRRYNVLPLWRSATADEPKRRQRAIRPKVSAGNHHV